jgi:hypothetical protein
MPGQFGRATRMRSLIRATRERLLISGARFTGYRKIRLERTWLMAADELPDRKTLLPNVRNGSKATSRRIRQRSLFVLGDSKRPCAFGQQQPPKVPAPNVRFHPFQTIGRHRGADLRSRIRATSRRRWRSLVLTTKFRVPPAMFSRLGLSGRVEVQFEAKHQGALPEHLSCSRNCRRDFRDQLGRYCNRATSTNRAAAG